MARPQRNDVDYFPFICKEGRAMFYIEEKYGNDGYATWIKLLRQLAVTNYHYLDLSNDVDVMFLSAKCKVSEKMLQDIILDLCKLGEFNQQLWDENKVVYSAKFIENIADAYLKRGNKPMSFDGLLHLLTSLGVRKHSKSTLHSTVNPHSIVYNTKVENIIEDKSIVLFKKEPKEDLEIEKQKNFLFDKFWNDYDKKVGLEKCRKKFFKLSMDEMQRLFKNLEKYILATPEKQYRKNPETYLNNKSFNDEIIDKNGNINSKDSKWNNFKVW